VVDVAAVAEDAAQVEAADSPMAAAAVEAFPAVAEDAAGDAEVREAPVDVAAAEASPIRL
jgi:hypothetical protein